MLEMLQVHKTYYQDYSSTIYWVSVLLKPKGLYVQPNETKSYYCGLGNTNHINIQISLRVTYY